ncbi:MAG: ribosome-associated translation inhibitor RaiA [Acholeplasmatales bacterium]|jgi:putative sigma-54 modulation protein|nr:ribosome-associated translation inhibitor RaiA [Acholeplasmatales bacterium]
MNLEILGKEGYVISEHEKQLVEQALQKIKRIFGSEVSGTTKAQIKKGLNNVYKVEITINVLNTNFRSEDVDKSIKKAINKASDKLFSQLVRGKEKIKNRFSRRGSKIELNFENIQEVDEIAPGMQVKVKEIILNEISLEDAIFELEQIGHTFYVYKDLDNHKTCVVYKRNDGNYGVIETQ